LPWPALRTVVGEIMYGGRVSNDMDLRCLAALAKRFVSADLVHSTEADRSAPLEAQRREAVLSMRAADEEYAYTVPDAPSYVIPTLGTVPNVDDAISQFLDVLPPDNSPELLGFSRVATLASDLRETGSIFEAIRSLTLAGRDGVVTTTTDLPDVAWDTEAVMASIGEWAALKSASHKISEALPKLGMLEQVGAGLDAKDTRTGQMNLVNVFLFHEVEKYHMLLQLIHDSLLLLKISLEGTVLIGPEMELLGRCITANLVPPTWQCAYPSSKPLASWINDLNSRVSFVSAWLRSGSEPISMSLPSFIAPGGLLVAVLQRQSQRVRVPLDDLMYRQEITPFSDPNGVQEGSQRGVFVHGLTLVGARLMPRARALQPMRPGQLACKLPVLECVIVNLGQPMRGVYECPLYRAMHIDWARSDARGTNLVTMLLLPGGGAVDMWILNGVAVFCEFES